MALLKCPDCDGNVSDAAPSCPHCGRPMSVIPVAPPAPPSVAPPAPAPTPKQKAKKGSGCGTLIFIVVAVGAITLIAGNGSGGSSSPQASNSAAPAAATPSAKEKEDACRQDVLCTAKAHIGEAEVYCKPRIEARALHDVKWTDKFLEPMMSRYKWSTDKHTAITYIGDKVAFQNGFGAYTPMIYFCTLDLASNRVTDLRVVEGRIPSD